MREVKAYVREATLNIFARSAVSFLVTVLICGIVTGCLGVAVSAAADARGEQRGRHAAGGDLVGVLSHGESSRPLTGHDCARAARSLGDVPVAWYSGGSDLSPEQLPTTNYELLEGNSVWLGHLGAELGSSLESPRAVLIGGVVADWLGGEGRAVRTVDGRILEFAGLIGGTELSAPFDRKIVQPGVSAGPVRECWLGLELAQPRDQAPTIVRGVLPEESVDRVAWLGEDPHEPVRDLRSSRWLVLLAGAGAITGLLLWLREWQQRRELATYTVVGFSARFRHRIARCESLLLLAGGTSTGVAIQLLRPDVSDRHVLVFAAGALMVYLGVAVLIVAVSPLSHRLTRSVSIVLRET